MTAATLKACGPRARTSGRRALIRRIPSQALKYLNRNPRVAGKQPAAGVRVRTMRTQSHVTRGTRFPRRCDPTTIRRRVSGRRRLNRGTWGSCQNTLRQPLFSRGGEDLGPAGDDSHTALSSGERWDIRCVRDRRRTDLVIQINGAGVVPWPRSIRLIQVPGPSLQGQEQVFRIFQQCPKESSAVGG